MLEQGYWPESHLAAPRDEALRREVELVKELGFNGVRIHQKVEDPRFLYWCDRLGLLVWARDAGARTSSTPAAVERLTREWLEVSTATPATLRRRLGARSTRAGASPSCAAIAAQQGPVRALYHLTRALDPSRPVIGNDGWEHAGLRHRGRSTTTRRAGDRSASATQPEAVEHTLEQRPARPPRRPAARAGAGEQPVIITEFGGIALAPDPTRLERLRRRPRAPRDSSRATRNSSAPARQPRARRLLLDPAHRHPQERNGLLYADRSPKVSPAEIASHQPPAECRRPRGCHRRDPNRARPATQAAPLAGPGRVPHRHALAAAGFTDIQKTIVEYTDELDGRATPDDMRAASVGTSAPGGKVPASAR